VYELLKGTPGMVLSLTLNSALDHVLQIPPFELNATLRAHSAHLAMGGKPTDASYILGTLGLPTHALALAAGSFGQRAEAMLQQRGVTTDFVWTRGETRLNTILVQSDGRGQTTLTADSLIVSEEHLAELERRFLGALDRAGCVLLGGSLPSGVSPEWYARLITLAAEQGVPVVFDSSGEGLRRGLQAGPTVVKPNRHELGELAGGVLASLDEIAAAARQLHDLHNTSVVVTLGDQGAVAILPNAAYHIPSLEVPVVNAAGAGDGVLAGMSAALAAGLPLEEGLRLGFAIAAAVLQTPATADCSPEAVAGFLPKIELGPIL